MKEALSAEAAVAEVKSYTGLELPVPEITSLYKILKVKRNDTAIITHLKKAHHPLGKLKHLPEGKNWWDKVHKNMLTADPPYHEEKPGTHKSPVAHDRNAVIFWLEHRILPPLTGKHAAIATSSGTPGTGPGLHAVQAASDKGGKAYSAQPPTGPKVPKSKVFEFDPDKQDRGTIAHEDTQNALAEALRNAGLEPLKPKKDDPPFDIAWKQGGVAFVTEVKSLTDDNEVRQIRFAIGQVLDYVHTLDREAWDVQAVRAVVAVECQPAKEDHWMGLCAEHDITLTWPEAYDDQLACLLAGQDIPKAIGPHD